MVKELGRVGHLYRLRQPRGPQDGKPGPNQASEVQSNWQVKITEKYLRKKIATIQCPMFGEEDVPFLYMNTVLDVVSFEKRDFQITSFLVEWNKWSEESSEIVILCDQNLDMIMIKIIIFHLTM